MLAVGEEAAEDLPLAAARAAQAQRTAEELA
jgi:hypothetical protein